MGYVISSYIADVTQAILDRVEDQLGESGSYTDPDYLVVRTFKRTGGFGVIEAAKADMPRVMAHYFHGVRGRQEIVARAAGFGEDFWGVYCSLSLDSDSVGYTGDDSETFRRIAEASAGLLMDRLIHVLRGYPPSVTCALTGKKSMYPKIEGWGLVGVGVGEMAVNYTIEVAYTLPFEH